jgi:hypothetical protein
MLTRRKVLVGTAAASIAAIASARGVASADETIQGGLDCGYGNLQDGVLGRFDKSSDALNVFLKFEGTAAEIFYNLTAEDGIQVFAKTFLKGWSPWEGQTLIFTKVEDAYFGKLSPSVGEFFVKGDGGLWALLSIKPSEEGVELNLEQGGGETN